MDSLKQEAQVSAKINGSVLQAQIVLHNLLYECNYAPPSQVNLKVVVDSLISKDIQIKQTGKQLLVSIQKGLLVLTFHHCCGKHWFQVGTLNSIPSIFDAYPLSHYEFGTKNGNWLSILPVNVCQWNKGIRLVTRDLMPWGDVAQTMKPARVMWTKGTSDQQSQKDKWFHQYVDQTFKPFASNGLQDPKLFAKKL